MNKFAFTCGDINGIGPEIVIKALNKLYHEIQNKFYFICPKNVFETASKITNPLFSFNISNKYKISNPEEVTIIDIGNFKYEPGKPTDQSGKAAFKAVQLTYKLASKNKIDAIITAPISKAAVRSAGYNYSGHTEMFAEWSGSNNYMMMFLSKKMNAALVTIHEPLKNVPKIITKKLLKKKIELAFAALQNDLKINSPKIALLGLNPHAGEEGYIGKEEEKIIKPVIHQYKNENIKGPFSPDAFFANKLYKKFDLVLGMYHDQILIPFKMINFGAGVNYTAGLPIIRTSPDHGTAFDIAGKNTANESSIIEAFYYAEKIIFNRKSE